jgi:hypothetical protein
MDFLKIHSVPFEWTKARGYFLKKYGGYAAPLGRIGCVT